MYANLQALRAVAAMLVAFRHSLIHLPPYFGISDTGWGNVGVDIFFVLSGFVIFLSAQRAASPTSFFFDRLTRVAPLYWLFLCVLAAMYIVAPAVLAPTTVALDTFVKSALFIPHYNRDFPGLIWPVLVPGWTLNYEMFFYVLCAVGLVMGRKRLPVYLAGTLLFLFVCGLYNSSDNAIVVTFTSPLLLEFAAGLLLACAATWGMFDGRPKLAWAVLIGAVLLLIEGMSSIAFAGWRTNIFIGIIFVVGGLVAMERNGLSITWRPLLLLGDASYSIYLSHLFTLGVCRVLWKAFVPVMSTWLAAPIYFAFLLGACGVAGIAVHYMAEKPLLDLSREMVRRSMRSRTLSVVK